jgi:hypothetical protein
VEEERRAVVGHGKSPRVQTSIKDWGVTMEEES